MNSIKVSVVEESKLLHKLRVEKNGNIYELALYGFSKFRLTDENENRWDSEEIDFKDKLRFSIKIFDRLISCFAFDLEILSHLIETEEEKLELYINTALTDIDMCANIFYVKEIPLSRGNMKLRAYLDADKLNSISCSILCSPEYRNLITRHNVKGKIQYIKMIASKNKVMPIVEKSLRSIEKEFKYDVVPMTPILVEDFLKAYLRGK